VLDVPQRRWIDNDQSPPPGKADEAWHLRGSRASVLSPCPARSHNKTMAHAWSEWVDRRPARRPVTSWPRAGRATRILAAGPAASRASSCSGRLSRSSSEAASVARSESGGFIARMAQIRGVKKHLKPVSRSDAKESCNCATATPACSRPRSSSSSAFPQPCQLTRLN
jgi:hypothetical protein